MYHSYRTRKTVHGSVMTMVLHYNVYFLDFRVEATLSSLGWKRIYDQNDTTFFLKWVECKRNLDFANFREGEQLVNHIPNGNLLTTKIGLLTSLQEFDRVSNKVPSSSRRGIQMKEFVPETFKLQNQTEIDNFIHHIYRGMVIFEYSMHLIHVSSTYVY